MNVCKRQRSKEKDVGVIFLAGDGDGRLAREMHSDPAISALAETPGPLLSVGGLTFLERWLDKLPERVGDVVVVVNPKVYQQYVKTLRARLGRDPPPPHPPRPFSERGFREQGGQFNVTQAKTDGNLRVKLVIVDSTSNFACPGVMGIERGLQILQHDCVIVICGEVVLPHVDVDYRISEFVASDSDIGILPFRLSDAADCVRRTMLQVGVDGQVEAIVPQPRTVAESRAKPLLHPFPYTLDGSRERVGFFFTDSGSSCG